MKRLVNTAKEWVRPVQRGVLYPVQHWFRLSRWQRTRRGAVVVNYHGVEPRIEDPRMQPFCVTAEQYRQSLRVILETHEVVPLDRVTEAMERGESPSPHWAVLTFDDGYVNTLTVARPILHEFGDLPATVFVCPGLIGKSEWLPDTLIRLGVLFFPKNTIELKTLGMTFPLGSGRGRLQAYSQLIQRMRSLEYPERCQVVQEFITSLPEHLRADLTRRFHSEQLVNWEQLRRLAAEPNIQIGGHTMHHTILHSDRSPDVLDGEIRDCREILESQLQREVRHFAYPGGAHCPAAQEAVRSAGYRSALTIRRGEIVKGADLYLLPRLTTSPHPLVLRRWLARAAMNGDGQR